MTLTFAVGDIGGPIKISAGVARTGDTVVLAKLGLIGAHRAADAPVGGGIIVVAGGTVHCRGQGGGVLMGKGGGTYVLSRPSSPNDLSDFPHHYGISEAKLYTSWRGRGRAWVGVVHTKDVWGSRMCGTPACSNNVRTKLT